MKNYRRFLLLPVTITLSAVLADSCSVSEDIVSAQEKAGTELWSENCSRCHNAPPPSALESGEWEVVGLHMRMRANLTTEETKKIVAFLQTGE